MNKPKKDPVREKRIHNDAIADANGPEEQVMGWYYYLDNRGVPIRSGDREGTIHSASRSGRGASRARAIGLGLDWKHDRGRWC